MTQIYEWLRIIRNYFAYHIPKKGQIIVVLIILALAIFLMLLFVPAKGFPTGTIVEINSGDSLQTITIKLHDERIIRSELVFRSLVILFGGEKKVIAGDYLLEKRQGAFSLAKRFVRGQFWIDTVRITIPEGWNVFQIGEYLEKNLVKFDKSQFLLLVKEKEGYLFPDTYFVSGSTKPAEIVQMMEDNFEKKITSVSGIATSTHSLHDIIIIASILEEEALPADRRIVAGILWKRLEIGMPLQVDSTFSYINGKKTHELTLEDLKIDSPYNTYKYKGLPPGPISNPGLDAIVSSLAPIKTKYLYFLTEEDGTIHYARTFEEHKRNKELYLR